MSYENYLWFDQFQENASEGTAPPEDVFKKPLPPTVKKEESPPPVRLSGCPGLRLGLVPNGKGSSRLVSHFDVGPLSSFVSQRTPLEYKHEVNFHIC